MLNSAKAIIQYLGLLIEKLNSTSIKRLLIYAMLVYPLAIMYFYGNELKLALLSADDKTEITNIAEAQQNCFRLRQKYGAETVQLYVYQPAGKHKTWKELSVFSTISYAPLASTKTIQLVSRTRVLEELRTQGWSLITVKSGHHESAIVSSFNMTKLLIIPIKDDVTGQIIGEVHWLFKNDDKIQINDLINDSQIFSYDITDVN